MANIYNTNSNTLLSGTSGNDTIKNWGYDGNPNYVTINAGGGNDTIHSIGDHFTINAGTGSDTILLDGWNDDYGSFYGYVNGGAGNDYIKNYGGYVTIDGGAGNDTLDLMGSWSTVNVVQYTSGDGNDLIYNWSSSDTLKITGGSYAKSTVGSNVLVTVGSGVITLSGAKGKTINISGTVSVAGGKNISNKTKRTLVSGTGYADTITNHAGGVTLSGGAGNDSIYNSTWSDYTINSSYGYVTIDGGSGNDTISSNDPYVSINGGEGNDYIYTYSYNYVTIKGGYGNDTIDLSGANYRTHQYENGDGNDLIYNWSSSDTLKITGGSYAKSTVGSNVLVTVGSGVITLSGAKGKTINISGTKKSSGKNISNSTSSTLITGTAYADSIKNYNSYVTINAGAGNDTIYNDYVNNVSVLAGDGNDYISNYSAWYSTVKAGDGNDTIIVPYRAWQDIIEGGAGNDKISLSSSSDSYNGKNTVVGGTGNDTIYGSTGASYGSVYKYTSGDGNDLIYNWSSSDTLKITGGSYAKSTVGSNVLVTVGSGVITLSGAKGKTINISGTPIETNTWKVSGTTATYGTSSRTLITITGVKSGTSTNNISLSGKTVTLKAAALSTSKVTISGDYKLALASDVTKSESTSKSWTVANGTALYKSGGTSAGYKLASDSKSITYQSKSGNSTLATITGIKSKSGISESNKIITVESSSIADGETVSVTGAGYKFKLNGTSGRNTLQGGADNDTLTGNGGADTFIYTGGNDIITDYTAQDKIKISTNYTGEISGDDIILTTSKGTLTIKNPVDKTITINGETKNFSDDGSDLPTGLNYNSDKTALIVGNSFTAGTIDLSKYASVLDVDASNYRSMNLKITGNKLNNSLIGGNGSDTINGGAGDDTLTGGGGMDVFVYRGGNDYVTDYTAGADKIKLANTDFKDIEAGENDILITTSTGILTLVKASGRKITIIDKDGKEIKQRYSANIAEILADNSVGDFENYTEKLTQESLITFAE